MGKVVKFISYKQVSTEAVSILRQSGFDVFYVAALDEDSSVESVCAKANSEEYILLTGNTEMAKSLMDRRSLKSGIVLLENAGEDPYREAKQLLQAIQQYGEQLFESYTIVGNTGFRKKPISIA